MAHKTFVIRASSWIDLVDCPARWKAKNIERRTLPYSCAAWTGTCVHESLALYDQSRISGMPLRIDDTKEIFAEKINATADVETDFFDGTTRLAQQVGLTAIQKYCAQFAPQRKFLAVEIGFDSLDVLLSDLDVTVRLTGTADRITRRGKKGLAISDIKTGARAVTASGEVRLKDHHLQLGVYELLAENQYGRSVGYSEIIGIRTNNKPDVKAQGVPASKLPLIGSDEKPGLIELAAKMLVNDIFPGNPRSILCGAKYCPVFFNCPYR